MSLRHAAPGSSAHRYAPVSSHFMKAARIGRPSKGPRRYVNSPVAKAAYDKLARYSELTSEGMGPTVARIFEAHIDDLHLEEVEAAAAAQTGQERMDLDETAETA